MVTQINKFTQDGQVYGYIVTAMACTKIAMAGFPMAASHMFPGMPSRPDSAFTYNGDVFFTAGKRFYRGRISGVSGVISVRLVGSPFSKVKGDMPLKIDTAFTRAGLFTTIISGDRHYMIGHETVRICCITKYNLLHILIRKLYIIMNLFIQNIIENTTYNEYTLKQTYIYYNYIPEYINFQNLKMKLTSLI